MIRVAGPAYQHIADAAPNLCALVLAMGDAAASLGVLDHYLASMSRPGDNKHLVDAELLAGYVRAVSNTATDIETILVIFGRKVDVYAVVNEHRQDGAIARPPAFTMLWRLADAMKMAAEANLHGRDLTGAELAFALDRLWPAFRRARMPAYAVWNRIEEYATRNGWLKATAPRAPHPAVVS